MTTPMLQTETGRTTLQVLAVVALMGASVYVLLPFMAAIVWAATIVIATWPILLGLQHRLGGRRGPAVAIMTVAMLALLLVPLYAAISAIVATAGKVSDMGATLGTLTLPPPPEWLASIPLLGAKVSDAWREISEGGHEALVAAVQPYVGRAVQALASQAGSFGATVVQFLVTTIVAAVLFASGEATSLAVRRFFRRLAGQRGEEAVLLAGKAIKAVALGVVVTALTQTGMAALGLFGAGIPRAGLLAAVTLVLCIAQIGPALVLIPAVIWTFSEGRTVVGIVFAVWTLATITVDNVLRPYLIKKGAALPLWLVFSGVVGGLLAFGVIGLFVGPVILAVSYTVLENWVGELGPEPSGPAA